GLEGVVRDVALRLRHRALGAPRRISLGADGPLREGRKHRDADADGSERAEPEEDFSRKGRHCGRRGRRPKHKGGSGYVATFVAFSPNRWTAFSIHASPFASGATETGARTNPPGRSSAWTGTRQ